MSKTDLAGLQRQIEAARKVTPAIAQAAAIAIAEVAARAMFHASPADTNRFSRAWALANNAAGLTPMSVPTVKPSIYVQRNRTRLLRQVTKAQLKITQLTAIIMMKEKRLASWYTDQSRKPDKFYRSQMREIDQMKRDRTKLWDVLQQAQAQLKLLTPTAIIIGGRKLGVRGKWGLSNLATVRSTIYGGTGRAYFKGAGAFVDLQNLEPHASIVASKSKVIPAAKFAVQSTGLNRGKFVVRREVAKGIPGGKA